MSDQYDNNDRQTIDTPVTESRLFSINSKNGISTNGTKNSAIQLSLPGFIMGHADSAYVTMKVLSAIVPNVFYNIDLDNDLYIVYTNDFTTTTTFFISIQPGHYDSYSLTNAMNTQLRKITVPTGPNITKELDEIITFSFNPVTSYVELTYTDDVQSEVKIALSPTILALGFESKNSSIPVFGKTIPAFKTKSNPTGTVLITADTMPDLAGVTNILLQSPQIPTINYSTELQSSFLANVPITSDFGYFTHYEYHAINPYLLPTNLLLDVIQIFIYDQNGNLVDFRGNYWSITIEVNYHRSSVPRYESLSQALKRLVREAMLHHSSTVPEDQIDEELEDEEFQENKNYIAVSIPQLNPNNQKYIIDLNAEN